MRPPELLAAHTSAGRVAFGRPQILALAALGIPLLESVAAIHFVAAATMPTDAVRDSRLLAGHVIIRRSACHTFTFTFQRSASGADNGGSVLRSVATAATVRRRESSHRESHIAHGTIV